MSSGTVSVRACVRVCVHARACVWSFEPQGKDCPLVGEPSFDTNRELVKHAAST